MWRSRPAACPPFAGSRFAQRLDAVAIKAFAGSQGFRDKPAVQGRFHPEHKLPAEFLSRQGFWQRDIVLVKQFNPFLHRPAKLLVHLGFVITMHAAAEKAGAPANKTPILVAPLHKLCAAGGLLSD